MPFLAFIKLISAKDWLYIGLILAILAISAMIYHRGELHVEAADAKVAAVQKAHNQEVQNTALESVNVIAQKYQASVSKPITDSPHVFVRNPASSCPVPQVAGSGVSLNAAPASADETTVDIGPPIDTIGRDADAQITALQAIIKADRAEINDSP